MHIYSLFNSNNHNSFSNIKFGCGDRFTIWSAKKVFLLVIIELYKIKIAILSEYMRYIKVKIIWIHGKTIIFILKIFINNICINSCYFFSICAVSLLIFARNNNAVLKDYSDFKCIE